MIRLATAGDLESIPAIELAAESLFSPEDLPHALRGDPTEIGTLARALDDERLWVAEDGAAGVVGFALVEVVDATPHLEEMDVLPSHGRRGIGRRLVRAILGWARDRSLGSVTLTTYRHLPWNGPFYERLGFRELSCDELGPGLREILDREIREGLRADRRIAMRHDLSGLD